MNDDDFLALSDERDVWLKRLLAAEKAAYLRGYAHGLEKGRQQFHADRTEDWEDFEPYLRGLTRPDYRELEERRYGPGGKMMTAEVRDGDYTGGAVEW